jgi:hypothetical protein
MRGTSGRNLAARESTGGPWAGSGARQAASIWEIESWRWSDRACVSEGAAEDKEVGVPASESVCAATIADRSLRLAVEVVHHGFREWRHAGSPIVNGG